MSDEKQKPWHGIPRAEILWFPTVDADACIGCQLCYVTCGRGVYEMQEGVAVAADAMNCTAGGHQAVPRKREGPSPRRRVGPNFGHARGLS